MTYSMRSTLQKLAGTLAVAAVGLTAVADSTVAMDPTLRTQRIAEARFLRALYYFDLVRMFGPVPLLLTPTQGAMTEANRDSVSAVYTAIVADLQFAEASLPDVQKD